MLRVFLFVAAAAFIAGAPAHADWQYTKWGMTPAQVVAASNSSVIAGPGEANEQLPGKTLGASGPYTSGQYRFKAKFYFSNNRLDEIRLSLEDPAEHSLGLSNSLDGVYGRPFQRSSFITTYHDPGHNNRVDLMTLGANGAWLIYRPLRDESAGGL